MGKDDTSKVRKTIPLPDPEIGTRIDWIRFKLGTGPEPGSDEWKEQQMNKTGENDTSQVIGHGIIDRKGCQAFWGTHACNKHEGHTESGNMMHKCGCGHFIFEIKSIPVHSHLTYMPGEGYPLHKDQRQRNGVDKNGNVWVIYE